MSCFGVYRKRSGAAQALKPGLCIVPATWEGEEAFAVVDQEDDDKVVHYNPAAPPGERITKEVRSE